MVKGISNNIHAKNDMAKNYTHSCFIHTIEAQLLDASSYDQSDNIQGKDKQKGVMGFGRDQASSSNGIHSMQATIPVLHVGNKEKFASNKWR